MIILSTTMSLWNKLDFTILVTLTKIYFCKEGTVIEKLFIISFRY